jgi:hypothetical protein
VKCCESCGIQIPAARLEFLPETEYCVNCADKNSTPVVARVIYSHKCDCELFIAEGKENVRRLNREWARAR